MSELNKIPRSLLGEINSEFKKFLRSNLDCSSLNFDTGAEIFDWIVPSAWKVKNFQITMPNGEPLIKDFDPSIHLVQYSDTFHGFLDRENLIEKINYIEEFPDVIPYKTSYYNKNWGINLPYSTVKNLPMGKYRVDIDVEFYDSQLEVFEHLIPGRSSREIIFHTYYCHPYMANDNNSGVAISIALAKYLAMRPNTGALTYRFIFVPETIGAIAYINKNLNELKSNAEKIFVLTCIGDDGPCSIIEAPYENAAGKLAKYAWKTEDMKQKSYRWRDRGSDERQYAAPGIELPVCTLTKTKFGEFDFYHTFDDDLNNVSSSGIYQSFVLLLNLISLCELDGIYTSNSKCEPMLSKRSLYPSKSVRFNHDEDTKNLTTLISLCDGNRTLVDVLEQAEIAFFDAAAVLTQAISNNLIRKVS